MELKDYTTEELEAELKKRDIILKFADYIQKQAKAYNFNLPHRSYDIYAFAKDLLAWVEKQRDKDKLIQELGKYKVKYTQEVLEKYINSMSNKNNERLRKTTIAFLKDFAEQGYENAVECIDWLEKQNEQKSTDKTEPKFKVGDWIVFNKGKGIYKVEKIENYEYTLRHILGGSMPLSFSGEELIRKWTIEDAKDGDVLVHSSFMFDNFIFIYNNTSILQAYCYYSNERNRFIIEDKEHPCPWNMQEVTPATKEQRDLLFTKMKEADYRWDFNKKELIKIEDEPEDYKQQIMSEINESVQKYID